MEFGQYSAAERKMEYVFCIAQRDTEAVAYQRTSAGGPGPSVHAYKLRVHIHDIAMATCTSWVDQGSRVAMS